MTTITIIKSQTPDGSAFDGEFASAWFTVTETADNQPVTPDDMKALLQQWNIDCHLEKFGNLKGKSTQAGLLVFIDDDPPQTGKVIDLGSPS